MAATAHASPCVLPGGLPWQGALARDYAFRPIDGHLELALAAVAESAEYTPDAVSAMLALALDTVAGATADARRVAELCVADRQWLMHQLERHLAMRARWASATCAACTARFDMRIDVDLPIKPAGPDYPRVRVRHDHHDYELRLPNGADQAWVARQDAARDATRLLAARLVRTIDGHAATPEDLGDPGEALLAAFDAALDDTAPAMTTCVAAACPECGHVNAVALDPYRALACTQTDLLDTVHRLASHYHWSEHDILAMPRARRRQYLERVDATQGPED